MLQNINCGSFVATSAATIYIVGHLRSWFPLGGSVEAFVEERMPVDFDDNQILHRAEAIVQDTVQVNPLAKVVIWAIINF